MSQYLNSKKRIFSIILPLLILGACCISGFIVASHAENEVPTPEMSGPEKAPPSVRVEEVGLIDSSQPKPYVGFVEAKETVVLVPRVSGYLEKIAFQEGEIVQKDDLLFEIEERTYEINVQAAKSVIKQIEAEIALAKRSYERSSSLHQNRVISEQELDEAQRTISLQEARLDEAKAKLAQAETDLSYTKIFAPLTGKIGAKHISEGNYLTPGSGTLASIVQYDPITVRFAVSETDFIKYLKNGTGDLRKTNIEILRVDGERYTGEFEIDFTDNVAANGTLMVYLLCGNADNQLLPGGFTRVKLSEQFQEPLPAVNVSALMTDGAHHYVYVLDGENQVRRRDVEKGLQVDNMQVITSGLTPGEHVLVGGLNKVAPGSKVQPVYKEKMQVAGK